MTRMNSENVSLETVGKIYQQPLLSLIAHAHEIHRQHFNPLEIQTSTLLSVKTGACPEDCGYCSQSGHHQTGLQAEKLWSLERVVERAKQAKATGVTRFCMGAAWRSPPDKQLPKIIEMIRAVKSLGLETCVTLGMLNSEQAATLKEAGLDYYNHNLDTSADYYPRVIRTRTYQDRLDTLEIVRKVGLKVCCGGILGMGESTEDRIGLLWQLVNLSKAPESVPINLLMKSPGTPLENAPDLDWTELLRTVATARILMPKSRVRLSAGRENMNEPLQTLCFLAGANSIFLGEKLLTTKNPNLEQDKTLLKKLGMKILKQEKEEALV